MKKPFERDFGNQVQKLWIEYRKNDNPIDIPLAAGDALALIKVFQADWKNGKINDQEFAHLVDKVLFWS